MDGSCEQTTMGGPPALGLWERLTTPYRKKHFVTKFYTEPRTWVFGTS